MLNETCTPVEPRTVLYTVETDCVDEDRWNQILARFEDADLLQTWAYGAARWGAGNLSHVLVKEDDAVVAAAQVVIKKVPVIGAGLAYVKGGPVWRLRGRPANVPVLRRILAALRVTYSVNRGLLLRVSPIATDDCNEIMRVAFEEEGFTRNFSQGIQRTVYLDLSYSSKELRSSLKPTWRRNLILAERNALTVKKGTSDELFDVFATLYAEMIRRKKVVGVVPVRYYQQMQKVLPEAFKMLVLICEHKGESVAGLVVPCLGNTSRALLSATGNKGLDLRGSYLLHWHALEWLKERGCRWHDLDAVNHAVYPGISQFKLGLAGRLGWEAEYVGQFDSPGNSRSTLLVSIGDRLRAAFDQTKLGLNGWRNVRSHDTAAG